MDERIARFQQQLDRKPDNELARFSLGKALFDAGRTAEAREHFVVALARKPDWMAVQILLAKCDLTLGDRAAARAGLECAHRLAVKQNHQGPREEVEQLLNDLRPA